MHKIAMFFYKDLFRKEFHYEFYTSFCAGSFEMVRKWQGFNGMSWAITWNWEEFPEEWLLARIGGRDI